jgi:hypothetical protein
VTRTDIANAAVASYTAGLLRKLGRVPAATEPTADTAPVPDEAA